MMFYQGHGTPRTSSPTGLCEICCFVCRGDSRIALGPSRTPVPTGFGENFDILIVGEDIILPCMTIPPSRRCRATSLCTREAFCLPSSAHLLTTNRGCAIENNLNRIPPRITFWVTLGGIYLILHNANGRFFIISNRFHPIHFKQLTH